jgi:hypothetical protein
MKVDYLGEFRQKERLFWLAASGEVEKMENLLKKNRKM